MSDVLDATHLERTENVPDYFHDLCLTLLFLLFRFLRNADVIIEMEDGQIKNVGTPNDVLNLSTPKKVKGKKFLLRYSEKSILVTQAAQVHAK